MLEIVFAEEKNKIQKKLILSHINVDELFNDVSIIDVSKK